MKCKAMIWVCGVIVTAAGLFLGVRGAARVFRMDSDGTYQLHPMRPDERRVCQSPLSDDAFSPDAFRDELLT